MVSKIYCIGDSHVSVFLGRDQLAPIFPTLKASIIPFFQPFRLGPVTAYNFCEYGTKSKGRENLEECLKKYVPKGSWIMFSAGEIDCRVHVLKQMSLQRRDANEITLDIAQRYLNFIKIFSNDFKICLMSPPPTGFRSEIDVEYPFIGSESERNSITSFLIINLRKIAHELKIPFIDAYSSGVLKGGTTNRKYLWDGVHMATLALPILVKQLAEVTGHDIRMPIFWRLREMARAVKR